MKKAVRWTLWAIKFFSTWVGAVWPFAAVLLADFAIAGFGQYNDILRRQCSTVPGAIGFVVMITLFGIVLMKAADRSLVYATGLADVEGLFVIKKSGSRRFSLQAETQKMELDKTVVPEKRQEGYRAKSTSPVVQNVMSEGHAKFLRIATFVLLSIGFLAVHITANVMLFKDPISDWSPGLRIWQLATPLLGLLGSLYVSLSANPVVLCVKNPLNPFELKPWTVASFFIGIAGLGILIAFPEPLKFSSALLGQHCAIVAHVFLLTIVFTVSSLRYLGHIHHFRVAPTVITLGLIAGLIGSFIRHTLDFDNRTVQQLPSEETKFLDVDKAKKNREPKDKTFFIFVADGGGIHAAVRAANVLGMMEDELPGSFDRIFATSTVSGGSVGTAMFSAYYLARKAGDVVDPKDTYLSASQKMTSTDLLTPVMARLAFGEPLGLLFPFDGFDRGKALEVGTEVAIEKTAKNSVAGTGLSAVSGNGVPYFCFNTTSAVGGDRFVLSNLKLNTVRCMSDMEGVQEVTFRSAATLSARFPIFPGAGRMRVSPKEKPAYDRILDGGVYDNSGIMTALDIVSELRRNGYQDYKYVIILEGNNLAPWDMQANVPRFKKENPFEALLAYGKGAAATLFAKNQESAMDLRKMYRDDKKIEVINFVWNGNMMQAPLGWTMDESRRRALSWMLGCREFTNDSGVTETFESNEIPKGLTLPKTWAESPYQPRVFGDMDESKCATPTEALFQIRGYNRAELQRLADLMGMKVLLPL